MRSGIYQSPILRPPLKLYFTPIKGAGGTGPLCPLAVPVPVVQPDFVNGGAKANQPSGGRVCVEGGGGYPSHKNYKQKL